MLRLIKGSGQRIINFHIGCLMGNGKEHVTNNQQPTTSNQQITTNNQQLTTNK